MVAYWLYHHVLQARGRARAEDSSYSLVEVKNSGVAEKECVNEYRIDMMNKAIEKIRALDQADYDKRVRSLPKKKVSTETPNCHARPLSDVFFSFHQITDFQMEAILVEKMTVKKKKEKKMQDAKGEVKFTCRSCSKHVCTGDDIQMIENMHRVNVTPEFRYKLQFGIDFCSIPWCINSMPQL